MDVLDQIKIMTENGFAAKRIAYILKLEDLYVRKQIKTNSWEMIKENFSDNKIDRICKLYKDGVSAKTLGIKFSIDKRRVVKWVKTFGILRTKEEAGRFTNFNQHIFDTIDTEEKAYWLGFFYADAYNCDITSTVNLALKSTDRVHVEKLAKFMGLPVEKITTSKGGDNDEYEHCSLKMYSKHLCEALAAKGCPRAKSFIITYPHWLDKSLTIPFIRGMVDGDGSISRRQNGEWKWNLVTTKECGEDIAKIILNELGLTISLSNISNTNNNTYSLTGSGNEKVLKFTTWLYKTSDIKTRLDRKYLKYLDLVDQQNNRTFTRQNYKISEDTKIKIITDLNNGLRTGYLATKYGIHARTIGKIKDKIKNK